MYRLGTRKQNNGAGRADCNFCRLSPYSLLTHPNPTRSGDAHKKKKKKFFLEKAQRYPRDIHSKKLPSESGGPIDSRLREKCARRLRWRHPVGSTPTTRIYTRARGSTTGTVQYSTVVYSTVYTVGYILYSTVGAYTVYTVLYRTVY